MNALFVRGLHGSKWKSEGLFEMDLIMPVSKKFVIGVVLIIANFIVGKIAVPLFVVESELGIASYLLSWIMLIAGLILCGREGLSYARLYYHHFQRKIKKTALRRFKHKHSPVHSDEPTAANAKNETEIFA